MKLLTPRERLEWHLTHLLKMLEQPFRENVKQYFWARALELAKDAELSDLPARLAEEMQRLEISKPAGPK